MNVATKIKGTYPSGQPYWLVQAFVGGRRIRRYFTDEEKADIEKERIDNSSDELLDVPERIIHEAWGCHKRLQERGWTLTRATDWVLEHVTMYDDQPPLKTLIDEYLAEQKASGIANATLIDLRTRLGKFCRLFGDRKVNEITTGEIRQWNRDMAEVEELGKQSRRNHLNKTSQFFRWCILNKKCAENPVTAVKRPRLVQDEVAFFTVDQCRQILDLAADHGLYHYVVLGLFSAIRPAELRRLRREHLHLDRRMITLGANITKKSRRRVIEMHVGDPLGDCLMAWLTPRPLPERIFAGNQSTFRRHFCRFRDRLGFQWIPDGLRHTAATYHHALTGDIIKTAALLECRHRPPEPDGAGAGNCGSRDASWACGMAGAGAGFRLRLKLLGVGDNDMKRLVIGVLLAFIVGFFAGGKLVGSHIRSRLKETKASGKADPALDMLVADTNSPVKFNTEVGEYQLAYQIVDNGSTSDVEYIFSYSPFTGSPLPSRRAELFMEPSAAETRAVNEKLKGATRTLADVEGALGKPDDIVTNSKTFKTEYIYRTTFKTLDVVVQEAYDGHISYSYSGKEKPRASGSN